MGYDNVDNAINIDLGNFITVEVDPENDRMTIGGAANFSRFFDPLYDAGKIIREHAHPRRPQE